MKNDLQPVRLYREFTVGEQTILGADPADSNDFCSAVVCSKKHLDFPLVYNENTTSAQFGYEIYNIAKSINKTYDCWNTNCSILH